MKDTTIHLGYEVGTGQPVSIPLRHLAVTGQTQLSGKTTTLEALIARSGLRAVAFVTKRGEGRFRGSEWAHGEKISFVAPYFRERADWQFVSSVLEATMRERMKFERTWIMRACKGAKTLADVQRNVKKLLEKAKGLNENIYMQLDAYLDIVVPQLAGLGHASTLQIHDGLNVMDLGQFSSEVQALIIRSVIEWVYQRETGTIIVIPEAWEFIPQQRGSPVKLAAEELIRKGGGLGNYLWLDSQDIAGVHKDILRQVGVYVMGVQREANEVKRMLLHLPGRHPKPKPDDIAQLGKGEFYVCFDRELKKVYVQPEWLDGEVAQAVALGTLGPDEIAGWKQPKTPHAGAPAKVVCSKHGIVDEGTPCSDSIENEEAMYKEQLEQLARELGCDPSQEAMLYQIRALRQKSAPSAAAVHAWDSINIDAVVQAVLEKINSNGHAPPPHGKLGIEQAELEVTIRRPIIKLSGDTLKGCCARLIAEGFLDKPRKGQEVVDELLRTGAMSTKTAKVKAYMALGELHSDGFLTRSEQDKSYQTVQGMKVRIIETDAAA